MSSWRATNSPTDIRQLQELKTRGHGDTGTRGQIGWGFDPNQFYAPYRRWGI
ncbi:MAG: hypothetical protein F6K58_21970 [Symploca sp. SIO2E9]|nr:hypothetical protein [Symploca sp. SIO2E9]